VIPGFPVIPGFRLIPGFPVIPAFTLIPCVGPRHPGGVLLRNAMITRMTVIATAARIWPA